MIKICQACGFECEENVTECSNCGYNFLEEEIEVEDENNCFFHQQEYQLFSNEQEKEVVKYKKRLNIQKGKENIISNFKKVFKVCWIIFGGIFNSVSLAIFGVIECLSLFGIPFGIVLFKIIPLAFNPIGKRVKTNFSKRPFLNILWHFFGGWSIALLLEIYSFILLITKIGLPIGLQVRKIAKYLWAPFGAQILNEQSFSDSIVEKQAYTIQYVRRNRLIVDFDNIAFDRYAKERLIKIYSVKSPISSLYKQKATFVLVMIPLFVFLTFLLIYTGFINLGMSSFHLFTPIIQVLSNVIVSIGKVMTNALVSVFSVLNVNLSSNETLISNLNYILPLSLILLILGGIIVGYTLFNKARKRRFDYGYASRLELINLYDCNLHLSHHIDLMILDVYKRYKEEIDFEISIDK